MSYFTNLTEKYKKIEEHIIKNKDANFISLGLFCPFFFSAYRFCLGDNYTLFQPIYSDIVI